MQITISDATYTKLSKIAAYLKSLDGVDRSPDDVIAFALDATATVRADIALMLQED